MREAMLCWGPGDRARVVHWPDYAGLSDSYDYTIGACCFTVPQNRRVLYWLASAWSAALRDGVSIETLHRALWVVDEYRAAIAPDVQAPAGKLIRFQRPEP